MANERKQAKTEIGVVTSTRRDKTITVNVENMVKHPKYGKYIRRRTKLTAHDEHETARHGDVVEVAFSRPLSKTKRWRFVRVVRSATQIGEVVSETTEPALEEVDTEEVHTEE